MPSASNGRAFRATGPPVAVASDPSGGSREVEVPAGGPRVLAPTQ